MVKFVTSSLLVVGLLTSTASAQKTELTFMRFFGDCEQEFGDNTDLDAAYGECGIITTLINIFNQESETVRVNSLVTEWPGLTQLNANLAAGTPPDIAVLHGIRIPNYASRGLLTPLGDTFAEVGIEVDDFVDTARSYATYNDQLFGLPLDLHGHLNFINMDLWQEAGLLDDQGDPELPVGEEEFLAAAEKMKEATGVSFITPWNSPPRFWMSLVYQQGGSIATEDELPNINTPEGLTALQFLIRLAEEGYAPEFAGTTMPDVFLNGNTASMSEGTWAVNFFDEQVTDPETKLKKIYVASFPQIYDEPAAWASSHMLVVPLGLEPDPARLAAIGEFLAFMNEHNSDWARTGHVTVKQSVLDSEAYQALPHREEYAAFAEESVAMPNRDWITAFETVIGEEFEAVFIGDKSPETALTDAQARLDDFAAFGQ